MNSNNDYESLKKKIANFKNQQRISSIGEEIPKSKIQADFEDLITQLITKRDPMAYIKVDQQGVYSVNIPQGQYSGNYRFSTSQALMIEQAIPNGKFILIEKKTASKGCQKFFFAVSPLRALDKLWPQIPQPIPSNAKGLNNMLTYFCPTWKALQFQTLSLVEAFLHSKPRTLLDRWKQKALFQQKSKRWTITSVFRRHSKSQDDVTYQYLSDNLTEIKKTVLQQKFINWSHGPMISAAVSALSYLGKNGSTKLFADMTRQIAVCSFQTSASMDSVVFAFSVSVICKVKGYSVDCSYWFTSGYDAQVVV